MRLALSQVVVHHGRVRALEGVDLTLQDGSVHVLAGPNGAGKSTLLGVILGLVRPRSGVLSVDDQRHDLSRRATPFGLRERIGYLPEAVAFTESLTGRQVLGFFGRARGVSRRRVSAVLERVGLAHAARRAVRGYSRGMRQRLGLGIAIIAEPELLVLDEPTVGLDQQGLTLLWDLLATWRAEGRGVVVSTHDLALIERRADRVSVLREGHLIACGTPDVLRERADLPVRVRFHLDRADVGERLGARFAARLGPERVRLTDDAVEVSVRADEVAEVVGLLDGELPHVRATRVDEPGLDEIYDSILAHREDP